MRVLLRNEIRTLSPGCVYIDVDIIISRCRAGARLRSMLTLVGVEDTIWHGRRIGRSLMSDVLESRLVLELRWHHLWFHRSMCRHARSIIIIVVVHAVLALSAKVGRTFVLICTSILGQLVSISKRTEREHTYWYLVKISPISVLEYSYSFLLLPNIITATSTEQRTESSCAFLNKPPLRLRNVLHHQN